MIRRRAAILGVLGIAVALFALISGLLLFQRSILYAPWTCSADEEASALAKYNIPPSAAVDLISKDKTIIRGYWLPMPGERANQLPTILYLHGNGGKIHWGLGASRQWQKYMSVNFFVISYRGFGRSEGSPTMEGVRQDSQAALDYLLRRPDVRKDRIVLFGHSLGGAVALHLAADDPTKVSAVIVENTFLHIARVVFGNSFLARMIEPLVWDRWNNNAQINTLNEHSIRGVRVPHMLLLVGSKDRTVPAWHGEALWDALQTIPGAPGIVRRFHRFIDGSHSCHQEPGYHSRIRAFLQEIDHISS